MYRLGHTGIALLVLAPLSYGLLEAHKPLLALVTTLGVLAIEPLPDFDFKLPFLAHRGVSHSLFAAVSVGGLLALCGWFVGMQGVTVLASVLGVTTEVITTVAASLESLAPPETTGSIVAWVVGLLTEVVATLDWIVSRLQGLDRQTIAGVGIVVGAGGILVHLLGDVLTVSGIQPFLPLSDWNLSVSSLRANSTLANTGFFAVGVLAVAVVLATTVAGIGVAVAPADISPVGVAAGQDASGPQNGSVTINRTETNRTQIVVESVTLPQNGYLVAQTGNLSANESATQVVGHTQYVRNGTFHDVILRLNQSIATGTTVSVTIYNDTNGNRTWDGVKRDTPYTSGGTPVHDTVRLGSGQNTASQSQNTSANATVSFLNQTTNGSTVTVQSVTLPENGFVAIHTSAYATGPAPADVSVIAVSQRLSAGRHHNVTIDVSNAPPGNAPGLNQSRLNETQTLAVAVYADSNANQRYDYVRSFGENDTLVTNNGSPVRDAARVRIPTPPRQTASVVFQNQTIQNATLTVAKARLPRGGFVIAHNASYRRTGDAVTSAVAISRYLPPGTYTNVTLSVVEGALNEPQVVTIRPSLDTNDNKQYDYVTSGGFQDVAYENRTGAQSEVVTASALVRVPASEQNHTTATARSPPRSPSTPAAGGETGGIGSGIWIVGVLVVLAVVGGVILLARRVR